MDCARSHSTSTRASLRVVGIATLALLLLVAAACGSSGSSGKSGATTTAKAAASVDSNLLIGTWHIVSYASSDSTGDSLAGVAAGTDPTVTFEGEPGATSGKLSVAPGCNTGGSSWKLDGDKITIDPIVTTMMACPNDAQAKQEAAIVQALQSATTVVVSKTELDLHDKTNSVVLVGNNKEPVAGQ